MAAQPEGPLWDAIRLAGEGAREEDFLAKAQEAKENITNRFYELWRETAILDSLVVRVAPSAVWHEGIQERQSSIPPGPPPAEVPPKRPSASARGRRTLVLAQQAAKAGATTVNSKNIAEHLSAEGFSGSIRDLSVGVGNILARSGAWKRIGPGEYQPI